MTCTLQCNLDEQQLTFYKTQHNHINWFSKGLELLRRLGCYQSFESNKAAYIWEDVITTSLGVIRFRQYSQEGKYKPFGRMWITNEGRTDPQAYHGLLPYIDEILVEKAGIRYCPSYSEISIDSSDESSADAFRKHAVPKRIDFEKAPYWIDPYKKKIPGFNPDPKGNQYFRGRADGIHVNSYPDPPLDLHYEIRLKRGALYNDNINSIPALLRSAPDLLMKRLYFMALKNDLAPELQKKTSAEAYHILCLRHPRLPKGKIRERFFDPVPLPNIPRPSVDNIYNHLLPPSCLEAYPLSHQDRNTKPVPRIFNIDAVIPPRCVVQGTI
jgi:hypothetical protein